MGQIVNRVKKRGKKALCFLLSAVLSLSGTFFASAEYNETRAYTGTVYRFTYDSSTLPSYFSNMYFDMRNDAIQSLPWLWKMNYDAGEYLNNSVDPLRSVASNASILTLSTHGDPGVAVCPDPHSVYAPRYTYLTGDYQSNSPSYMRGVGNLNLQKAKLVLFASCNSAYTSSTYGNLVSDAYNDAGASCAMGWMSEIPFQMTSDWIEYFFQACYFNKATINSAAATATQRVRNEHPNSEEVDMLAYYANINGDTYIYS